jgi:Cof subfamily protein (haloacid dehalogenase superfamily)
MMPTSTIKLVALDLDGTVVGGDLRISGRVLRTLTHLITRTEVRVVIATGRMFASALPFARQIGVLEPLVIYHGAMVRSMDARHTMRFHTPIPLPIARDVLGRLVEDRYDVNLYLDDQVWTHPDNRFAAMYMKTAGVTPNYHDNLLVRLDQPPTKLMVIDDERLDHLLEHLGGHYREHLSFCRSRSNFCEITDVSASKWNALRSLAEEWGIRPEEILAIGDQGNDISMIRNAGVGVAMGNAPDDVKAEADFVTLPIDRDGVVEAIERFVLK